MDKFAVLYQIGDCAPHVEDTFDNMEDAKAFADIMQRKHADWKYAIYVNEEWS